MKTLFLTSLILLLVTSHTSLTIFPGDPLESHKAYFRGICASTSTDCDLSPMSSCWDDTSSAKALTAIYQACADVANASPQESHAMLKAFFSGDSAKLMESIADAIECERKSPYARMVFEKVSTPELGIQGVIANVLHYASVRPEETFLVLKQITAMAEQGNFEAVGLLDGNFISQAAALEKKEHANWRNNARNARKVFLKGLCESLGLECPEVSSLNCMDEESSRLDLQFLYDWFESVAVRPISDGAKYGANFIREKGKELIKQIPREAIECDQNSVELKLVNEKLGFNTWSIEWAKILADFMNEFPESCWYYKVSEYKLFENNDLEGVGAVMGIAWYHVAEWQRGRLIKEQVTVDL